MKTLSHLPSLLRALFCFLVLGVCGQAGAVTPTVHLWSGNAGDGLWSNAGNWATNGKPTSGETGGTSILFSSNRVTTMDIPGLVVDAIEFLGTGNVINVSGSTALGINGNVLTVNIQNDQGTNTIACPLHFSANAAILAVVTSGSLTLSGNLSSAAGSNGLVVGNTGTTGTLILAGNTNSYTGTTSVQSGTLVLNSNGLSSCIPGPLVVGRADNTEGTATVQLAQGVEIADGAAVTVNAYGVLDFNNHADTIGSLTMFDGSVTLGSGSLQTTTLAMSGGSITATTGTVVLMGDVTATSSAASPATISLGSGSMTLNNTTRNFTVNPGPLAPDLKIIGVIGNGTVTPSGLKKTGTGTMDLLAGQNYTFSGTTTVDQGLVRMNTTNGHIINGPVVIGNGTDPAGSATLLEFVQSNDIAATSAMTINASGIFDLSSEIDTLASLTGTGSVHLGSSGKLTLGNATNFTFGGTISGNGVFTKAGVGTMMLTGSISTSGTMVVADGELDLNMSGGASNWTSSLQIGDDLGGANSASVVLLQQGQLNALHPINIKGDGLLNANGKNLPTGIQFTGSGTGSVTLGSGGTLTIRIGQATNDDIGTIGTLTAGGILAFSQTGTPSQNAYVIATWNGFLGAFASITGVPPGYSVTNNYYDGISSNHIALVAPGNVVTGAASNVLASSARLNGTVDSGNKTLSWYFEYGTSIAYGQKTPVVAGLKSTSAKAVAAQLSGLNGGQVYHYRLVAFNAGGPYYGFDQILSTPGPVVTTTGASPVSALSATLNGMANPKGSPATAWFEYGLTTAYGTKTVAQSIGNGNAAVTIHAALTNLAFGKLYHYRIVAKNAVGTSSGPDITFNTLVVFPPLITLNGQPVSKIVAMGVPTVFSVAANEGSPFPTDTVQTWQWRRNGVPVPGAKLPAYFLASTLAQAGTYSCLVSNSAGSTLSGNAELAVVDQTPKNLNLGFGTSTTLTANAAGNGLSYQWYKNAAMIPGAAGKTLSLPALQPTDDGAYYCKVQSAAGSLNSGTFTLAVFDAPPIILTPLGAMPPGIVGGLYSFQIPVNTQDNIAAASFTATGLPPGLTVNATGIISGRITAAITADKTYTVSLKASNSQGSPPAVPTSILVHPFPTHATGTYSGLVARDALPPPTPSINGGLGGSVSVTITGIGSFTGKLVLGGASYSLNSTFNTSLIGNSSSSSLVTPTITITRAPPLDDLLVNMSISTVSGVLSGTVKDAFAGATQVGIDGDLNPWNATSNKAPLAATYTTGIKIANNAFVGTGTAANIVYPQGAGYATVTITPAGSVTWIGKMGDGTSPATTYTTTMALDGSFPVHLMLDANTGASNGFISASADINAMNGGHPLLDGSLDWNKIAAPGSTNRTYKSIPLLTLTVAGSQYVNPAAGVPVLGVTTTSMGNNNAKLVFTDGGLTSIASTPPVTGTSTTFANSLANLPLRITTSNTADFSASMSNPAAVTLTLNTTTGAMSGTFTLIDSGVTRKVSYFGLLVPRLSVKQGVGYFLMSELPSPTTMPILSGQVILSGP